VDIGTSSVRVLAFDAEDRVLGRRQCAYGTHRPHPFFEEQDPNLVWEEVYRAMRDLVASREVDPEAIGAYGGIVTNVGNAYQWLGSNVVGAAGIKPDKAYEILNHFAAQTEPGAAGLLFLPYLRKARSP